MHKEFHNVRNTKKMLAYGVAKGMGAFRPRPRPVKTARKEERADERKENMPAAGDRGGECQR